MFLGSNAFFEKTGYVLSRHVLVALGIMALGLPSSSSLLYTRARSPPKIDIQKRHVVARIR